MEVLHLWVEFALEWASFHHSKPPIVIENTSQIKKHTIIAKAKRKYKYSCNSCGNILWGKRG
jgi:hypothetical protein